MSLTVSCQCGARFEVEETFAGQTVSCPECQQAVAAAAVSRGPVRTSGWAVASLVVALVLAFTGVGPLLAVLLGAVALVSISRSRGQLTGAGFAVFGMVLGGLATAMFFLVLLPTELFGLMEAVREGQLGGKVDRTGPLEVVRADEGFAIKRPTTKWGVADRMVAARLKPDSELVLVNVAKDAYIDVTVERLNGRDLDRCGDDFVDAQRRFGNFDFDGARPRSGGLTVRQRNRLPARADREAIEILLDMKLLGRPITYLVWLVRPTDDDRVFVIRCWALQRRFVEIEPEMRESLASFRTFREP